MRAAVVVLCAAAGALGASDQSPSWVKAMNACSDPYCNGNCPLNPMHKDDDGKCVSTYGKRIVVVGGTFQEGKFPYLDKKPIITGNEKQCMAKCLENPDCHYGTFVAGGQQSSTAEEYNHGRAPVGAGECWLSSTTHSSRVPCGVECVGFRKQVSDTVDAEEASREAAKHSSGLGGACFMSPTSDKCCADFGYCWDGTRINRNKDMNSVTWCAFDYAKQCPPKPPCRCNPAKHESNFVKCHHDHWTKHIIVKHLEHKFHGAPISDHQQHRCMTVSRDVDRAECACCDCNNDDKPQLPPGVTDLGVGKHLVGEVMPMPVDTIETCAIMCEQDRKCRWGSFSASERMCSLGMAEPKRDRDGKLEQVKCMKPFHASDMPCHAFMLHTQRSFHKSSDLTLQRHDEEGRPEWMKLGKADGVSNPNAKRQIRADPTMQEGSNPNRQRYCTWDRQTRTCGSLRHDDEPSYRKPVQKELHQDKYFRFPFVERHLIPGMVRDKCVQQMQLGHNVQWMCPPQDDLRPWGETYKSGEEQKHPYRIVKGAETPEKCNRVRPCAMAEVKYDGYAFSRDTKEGFDSTPSLFGTGKRSNEWVGGSVRASIGYAFKTPRAINGWVVEQYPRSCSKTNHGCCQPPTTVEQPDGSRVRNFCDDRSGDLAFRYCKVIHIEHSDDQKTWSRAGVFRAQIGYNKFGFIGDGMKHKYWQMVCGDDDVTEWTLPPGNGIRLFEAEAGCTDDGLGARRWYTNRKGFSQCIYGCGCYTGCNTITTAAREITTEAECNTHKDRGITMSWDDNKRECRYSEIEAEQRCSAATDAFSIEKMSPTPCHKNERYVQSVVWSQGSRCERCPEGEFMDVDGHFLTSCKKRKKHCGSGITAFKATWVNSLDHHSPRSSTVQFEQVGGKWVTGNAQNAASGNREPGNPVKGNYGENCRDSGWILDGTRILGGRNYGPPSATWTVPSGSYTGRMRVYNVYGGGSRGANWHLQVLQNDSWKSAGTVNYSVPSNQCGYHVLQGACSAIN